MEGQGDMSLPVLPGRGGRAHPRYEVCHLPEDAPHHRHAVGFADFDQLDNPVFSISSSSEPDHITGGFLELGTGRVVVVHATCTVISKYIQGSVLSDLLPVPARGRSRSEREKKARWD